MKSALLATTLLAVSVQAHAVFVVDGTVVLDTITGLEWLNLDQTRNLSAQYDVRDNLNPGGDFRRAGAGEVFRLFDNARDSPSFGAAFNGYVDANGFESFAGFLLQDDPPPPVPGEFWYAPPWRVLGWGAVLPIPGYYTLVTFTTHNIEAFDQHGAWVVREVTQVPEPRTWLLMLLGLGFCFHWVRRSSKCGGYRCRQSALAALQS